MYFWSVMNSVKFLNIDYEVAQLNVSFVIMCDNGACKPSLL